MRSTKQEYFILALIKYVFSASVLTGLTACGSVHDGHDHSHYVFREEESLPESLQETLVLSGNQLFSLKNDSEPSSSRETNRFASTSLYTNEKDSYGLYILDSAGKGKPYMRDANFDRLIVIRDGSKTAYLARLKYDFSGKQKIKAQWQILKDGDKPIQVAKTNENIWAIDTEFIGQTESNGGLVFSDGNYVNLNGQKISYGKNINTVTRAMFVSGDYVAIEREIAGNRTTTIVNVQTGFRKGYGSYFAPNFVGIGNDGKGLISDMNKNTSYSSTDRDTQISSLKAELSDAGTNRTPLYKSDELGHCMWFINSVRIKKPKEAAMLVCYVSEPYINYHTPNYYGYRLMLVEPQGAGWKTENLKDLASDEVWGSNKNTFTQGDGFTLMRSGADFFHIPHSNPAGINTLKTNFASLFDIRVSDDLKHFVALGEMNNGDQLMKKYDADGKFVDEHEITIE